MQTDLGVGLGEGGSRKPSISSLYALFGTPISVMGLCFKIWDTGAIKDPSGSQSPTPNYNRALSTFSGTEVMGWSYGVTSGQVRFKPTGI